MLIKMSMIKSSRNQSFYKNRIKNKAYNIIKICLKEVFTVQDIFFKYFIFFSSAKFSDTIFG